MNSNKHDYQAYVDQALNDPGTIAACYSAFWSYSFPNQMLARWQLGKAEPINTYKGWQALGRQVKKGSKAIALLMPVTIKDKADDTKKKMIFISKRNWFGLSMTDGEDSAPVDVPGFSFARVLEALGIKQEPFAIVDGNVQGYAKTQESIVAVNPIAYNPDKTMLHEIAHCLLHADCGASALSDTDTLRKDVREVEAELTAYLVSCALGRTEKLSESRGYIQHWLASVDATDAKEKVRYGKVFGAADKILKAGRPLTA